MTDDRRRVIPSLLGMLKDVDTSTTPPADGNALIWDNTAKKWKPQAPAGVLMGGSLWFNVDSDAVGSSLTTITDSATHTALAVSVTSPINRRWLVTLTCRGWHWTNSSSEPTTNPWFYIKPSGTATITETDYQRRSPNVGSNGATTLSFIGFTLVGAFTVTAAGTATFTARMQNASAGVSTITLEGPMGLSVVDGGPA